MRVLVTLVVLSMGCGASSSTAPQSSTPNQQTDLGPKKMVRDARTDTDGDGIPDDVDACPTQPEDHKPPDPNDGCPAPP
jgi:hypothetical protein